MFRKINFPSDFRVISKNPSERFNKPYVITSPEFYLNSPWTNDMKFVGIQGWTSRRWTTYTTATNVLRLKGEY